jgi:hypothetical protein
MNSIEQFKIKGYAVVPSVISDELRDFVTQYALFDEMQDFNPDNTQVKGAHSKYADPAMEAMLLHLHKLIEEKTGLSLYPTYSFYRVYRNGDILEPHMDRPSCEVSATVCFNHSYTTDEYSWPIIMNGDRVNLSPGDLVVYRGCDLTHSRDIFSHRDDSWHVQGFFHYVDAGGPYSDYQYDKRSCIGESTNSKNSQNAHKNYIRFTQ